MVARVLDPTTNALILVCGPGWGSRCGAAGEASETVYCAGHPTLSERDTPEGTRVLRVMVPASQRTCPFGPPEVAG
ncbi:MAG: hypothetical protein HYY42_07320 [Chloroflexi bacterium]|nr:hypothetical protein [Chloroflexota bacterium]